MELQKLTVKNDKLYLDGVEIRNVKDFILKYSATTGAELNVTLCVTMSGNEISVTDLADTISHRVQELLEERN